MFKLVRFEEDEERTLSIMLNEQAEFVCYCLEPPWKNNEKNISRIPDGTYKATRGIYKGLYDSFLLDTSEINRDRIWIHIGNSAKDTSGCILTGKSVSADRKKLLTSTGAHQDFMTAVGDAVNFELLIYSVTSDRVVGDIRKKKFDFEKPKELPTQKPKKQKINVFEKIVLLFSKIKPYLISTMSLAREYVPGWAKLIIDLVRGRLQNKGEFMKDPKNTISNWVGIVVLIGGAIQTYIGTLNGDPINWLNLGMAVAVAVIAYFTGKTKDIKAKP